MTEFVAALAGALLGALVGAAGTFYASWWQTKKVLTHEVAQARLAAEDERRASRESVARAGALHLLAVVAELRLVLPQLRREIPSPLSQFRAVGAAEDAVSPKVDALRRAEWDTSRLVPADLRDRWSYLVLLTDELRAAAVDGGADPQDRSAWTAAKVGRGAQDLANYLGYVRDSLLAFIDDRDLPAHKDPPVLRRFDMAAWQPPAV